MKKFIILSAIALSITFTANVFAAATSATVGVGGSVAERCSVNASGLSFGAASSSTATNSTANVYVSCSSGLAYKVLISEGQNSPQCTNCGDGGGTTGERFLRGPAGTTIPYSLFSDSARTLPWPALGQPGIGTGAAPNTHVIYAQIPAVGNAEPGSYTDTVTVIVNY